MRNVLLRVLCVSLTIGCTLTSIVSAGEFMRAVEPVPGRYIVLLTNVHRDNVPAMARTLATNFRGNLRLIAKDAFTGFSVEMSEPDAIALSLHPNVQSVEEVAIAHLSSEQTLPLTETLWALDRIDQASTLLDHKYYYCEKGASVIAYVVDSGINKKHTEFLKADGTSRVVNGVKFADDHHVWPGETNDFGTYPCGAWTDNYIGGHGTSVASVLGGKTVGVAKAVTLVPIRVTTCDGVGTNEYVAWGIDWIKSADNPDRLTRPALVNISMFSFTHYGTSGGVPIPVLNATAIEAAINNIVNDSEGWIGIPVIVSANNQDSGDSRTTPARMAHSNTALQSTGRVISVGGTTATDARWDCPTFSGEPCSQVRNWETDLVFYGSNFGPTVDIWAPAHKVESAHITSSTSVRILHVARSGTSFSAPLVSGVVARMLQASVPTIMSPTAVWTALQNSAQRKEIDSTRTGEEYFLHRAGSAVCNPELP